MNDLRSIIINRRKPNQTGARMKILMVTHVIPYPPAAGNEIRIYKLLKWLHSKGYIITLVLRPLEDVQVSNTCITGLRNIVDDLHIYDNRVAPLSSKENAEYVLDKDLQDSDICSIQDGFCPVWFAKDVENIIRAVKPDVVIAQYVFMSRILNLQACSGALKIIDSHDLFCKKQATVEQYGIKNYGLSLSEEVEKILLDRADIVLAIQAVEMEEIKRLLPEKKVLLTSFDLDVIEFDEKNIVPGQVLIVASGNEFNVKGTQDFIDYTWPLVREKYRDARLHVLGRVCKEVHTIDPSIELMGFVENIDDEYEKAEIVINPCRVGTGLKIKTIEALSRGKAHVAWPSATDGLNEMGFVPIRISENIVDFASAIEELLRDSEKRSDLANSARDFIRKNFATEIVYANLSDELEAYATRTL